MQNDQTAQDARRLLVALRSNPPRAGLMRSRRGSIGSAATPQ